MTAPVRRPPAGPAVDTLGALVEAGQLHQADATPIADAIRHNGNRHAVYIGLERLAAVQDDVPPTEWWRLLRLVAPAVTAEQVARVTGAAADLALLRAEGMRGLRHFQVRPTPDGWRAAMQDRCALIEAVAAEVTTP